MNDTTHNTTPAPRVSVCVPVYNGATYLQAALDSIDAQTFRDLEVVIIDDGSTDGSVEIARRFAQTRPHARVVSNAVNLGLVGNWNRCIELSRGHWIKFVFQDDLLEPDCIGRLVAAGDAVDAGLVACGRTILFEDGTNESLKHWHAEHDLILRDVHGDGGRREADAYCEARLAHLQYNIVGEPTVFMIRRADFDRWGGFDPTLVQMCDAEMCDRVATNTGIVYIAEPLATFRVHRGSASGKNRAQQFRSGLLEEISYLHKLCYQPAFDHLRAMARRLHLEHALKRRLAVRVNMARDQLRWAGGLGRDEGSMRRQYDDVMARLPEVRSSDIDYLLFRMRRWLNPAFAK